MLEKDDINFNIQNDWGNTGFMMACGDHPELLEKMLENNQINKTFKDKNGLTGYDVSQKYNPGSFEVYQAWLAENERIILTVNFKQDLKNPTSLFKQNLYFALFLFIIKI